MRRIALTATALILIIGAGCGQGKENSVTSSTGSPSSTSSASEAPSVPSVNREEPRVKAAITDAAKRFNVKAEDIQAAELLSVTWSDGSLGCPEKGKVYTQALVPGERLLLRANGKQYSYHAAEGKEFGYCETPSKAKPATSAPTTK